MNVKSIISQMTLEEKASLCSGLNYWCTKPIDRLGIPSIMMCDGPHGIRQEKEQPAHVGHHNTEPATCYPTASLTACSWDTELAKKLGSTIGIEAQAQKVAIVLGPGANIKRSPLCGRNFEYLSEDPFLSSKMAGSIIEGTQSEGVGTSLKHFAANNQEHKRLVIDAQISTRALRELYLASFEDAVKRTKPSTMMCAYNSLNGEFCSQNKWLLTDLLRDEWGYEGIVMSDWGAVSNRIKGIEAGLDLEMPSSKGLNDSEIVKAVKDGTLSEETLDITVERMLTMILSLAEKQRENVTYDVDEHDRISADIARECMVLLKNEDDILPLSKSGDYAVIGALAKNPRYQGSGSSRINPTKISSIFDGINLTAPNAKISYSEGYSLDTDESDSNLISEAVKAASGKDAVILVVGLPDSYESEGYDRWHMRIPQSHIDLIKAVYAVNSNVVAVLCNGSPVEMPWIGNVKGVLEAYLGGQAGGIAAAELIFGDANPCGKLAESFPLKLEHNPSYTSFPGEGNIARYDEGLFVGYRYYDKKKLDVLFPFGFGLSYTQFEYSDLKVSADDINEDTPLTVSVLVKNTGKRDGKEIVQLYVKDVQSNVIRPEKELKGFTKVSLKTGEQCEATFTLDRRSFAFYSDSKSKWLVESGEFELMIGASSQDIRLSKTINVTAAAEPIEPVTENTTLGELKNHPNGAKYYDEFADAFGLKPDAPKDVREMTLGLPLSKARTMGFSGMTWGHFERLISNINLAI